MASSRSQEGTQRISPAYPGLIMAYFAAIVGSFILFLTRMDEKASLSGILVGGGLLSGATLAAAIITARYVRHEPPTPTVIEQPRAHRTAFTPIVTVILWFAALLSTVGAWLLNVNNTFTASGVLCWLISVSAWYFILTGRRRVITGNSLPAGDKERVSRTTLGMLAVILLIGAWFRFRALDDYPPDMTSDQVENVLDIHRVLNGESPVFFPNNEGRESVQMYYLALLQRFTGLPVSFSLLKLGSGLEGMLTIVLVWWMGRVVIGGKDPGTGNLVGLIAAALVAISYWHVILSRLGLRAVTITVVTAIILTLLVKAIRFNRRWDWVLVGLALGASLYTYQAARILPAVVIAGFALACIAHIRQRRKVYRDAVNLLTCVVMAVVVFIPLGHYMLQYPEDFWHRTTSTLFGDQIVVDPRSGQVLTVLEDRSLDLAKTSTTMIGNLGRAALMFNWRGDGSWFNGSLSRVPALDFFAGGMFTVGLGLIVVRAAQRRDPVDWLIPVALLILLLPTVFSLTSTDDVPSFLRAGGTLPVAYLVAAVPLAVLLDQTHQLSLPYLDYLARGIIVFFLLVAGVFNFNSYFLTAMKDYREQTWPYHQAGQVLHQFVDRTGAPGNAFIVAYSHWWDHRAVAIEAGDPSWNNVLLASGGYRLQDIVGRMRQNAGSRYEVRPDQELIFFLYIVDGETMKTLPQLFPGGKLAGLRSFNDRAMIVTYTVPPIGCDWVLRHVGVSQVCQTSSIQPVQPNERMDGN